MHGPALTPVFTLRLVGLGLSHTDRSILLLALLFFLFSMALFLSLLVGIC